MPLDILMVGLLVVLTIGTFAYVFGLKKLPWRGTSCRGWSRCSWPSTCLLPSSFPSVS